MKYSGNIISGIFVKRMNRFIAIVEIDGVEETCHVKNTARCRELLLPGAKVYLEESDNPMRKTRYSLVAVKKGRRLVNLDSQIPNAAAYEWVKTGRFRPDIVNVRREVTFGKSRFDLYAEAMDGTRMFIEVKGVSLVENDVVRFPDAPTERGVKHIYELCEAVKHGYDAYILFVIQMEDVVYFRPNDEMQKELGDALRYAVTQGVRILAMDCKVTPDSMTIHEPVPVRLEYND